MMAFRLWLPQRWPIYLLAVLIALLSLVTVVGERGAVHLWRLRGEKNRLDEQNYQLQKENEALRQRISRIRNDNRYLEKLAREELNMVRPGEVVYRLRRSETRSPPRQNTNDADSESRPSAVRKEPR
jgi:cell division protein FtsB